MSISVETTSGLLEIPDISLDAVRRRADFVATFMAQVLDTVLDVSSTAKVENQAVRFPPGFLLDLGAICVLALWERWGITAHIKAGLPTRSQATAELLRTAKENPQQFDDRHSLLSNRVLQFWVENFAWDGVETFGVDIRLDVADENAIVEAAADFLWENRHALPEQFQN